MLSLHLNDHGTCFSPYIGGLGGLEEDASMAVEESAPAEVVSSSLSAAVNVSELTSFLYSRPTNTLGDFLVWYLAGFFSGASGQS